LYRERWALFLLSSALRLVYLLAEDISTRSSIPTTDRCLGRESGHCSLVLQIRASTHPQRLSIVIHEKCLVLRRLGLATPASDGIGAAFTPGLANRREVLPIRQPGNDYTQGAARQNVEGVMAGVHNTGAGHECSA
jgi:hypothetical protein